MIKIISAKTILVKVPNKYLFLNSDSLRAFALAQVFIVIIIATTGKLSKYAKITDKILLPDRQAVT